MIRYGAALLFLAGALLVRWAMDPLLAGRLPLSTVYAAIVFAVLWGGIGPGIVVSLLGYVAADYLFIEPRGMVGVSNAHFIAFAMHFATSSVILLVGHKLQSERALRTGAQRERDLLERQARIALQAAHLGSFSWFPPDTVIADARCREMGQLPRDTELTLADINRRIHPEDLPRVQQARLRAIDPAGDGSFAQEYRFVRDDGSIRFIASHGQVEFEERDGRRRPFAMHGAIMDITARLEEAARLREADRRKDEFLATLAHELRNPLAPIRNAVELLRLQYPQEEGVQRLRGLIDRQLRQLTRLVDDLLEVSRITRGVIPLRRGTFDLSRAMGEAVEAVRPQLEEARHALDVKLPEPPVQIDADEARIVQVVQNLLHNAVRYTPRGGHICLEVARAGDGVSIVVRDTGIGIAPEQMARVFEMFARGTAAMEHNREGLGIGLALVKGIVTMHGGRVAVASDGPGRGSTFTVWLPLAPQ